jgi:hypothetical protein
MPDVQIVSCNYRHWELAIFQLLKENKDVDLTHLNCDVDVKFCEAIAQRYSIEMRTDPKKKVIHFRNSPPQIATAVLQKDASHSSFNGAPQLPGLFPSRRH